MAVQTKNHARTAKMFIGAFLVLFSAPCIIGMIHDLVVGADNLVGALIVGSFFTIVAAIGIFTFWRGFRAPKTQPLIIDAHLERQILQQAQQAGGILSVTALAMNSNLTLQQAEEALDEFHRRGFAQTTVSDSGTIEYAFPDLQNEVTLDDLDREIQQAVAEAESKEKVHQSYDPHDGF